MKKFALSFLALAVLASCQPGDKTSSLNSKDAPGSASPSDIGYAFGVSIGESLKATGVAMNLDSLLSGMKDVIEKDSPKVTPEAANETIQTAIMASKAKLSEVALGAEKKYLEENGKKPGVKTTASGLQYEVVLEGSGKKPLATDTVKVHYTGKLLDGTVFDSSVERKEPATFPLNGVIPGWTEGIQLMTVGSKYKFTIPSKLGYGERGAGAKIVPNSTLIFDVELLGIEKPAVTATPKK